MLRSILLSCLLASCCLFALGSDAGAPPSPPVVPGELLGSTGAMGASLITIDPMTGAGTARGPLGAFGPVTEIEFRADGMLFGTTGGGSSNLVSIDPNTGAETLIVMHAVGAINGLEFVGMTLYGTFFDPATEGTPPTFLVEVDPSDGSLTTIGLITDFSPVRGLAYDESTSTMYAVGSGTGREGFSDQLLTIDLATGTPTVVGPTDAQIVGGIEFGPDGQLYGGIAAGGLDEGVIDDGDLVVLNLATGDSTVIGPTGFPAISGLTFVPGGVVGGGPSAVEIPTASELGLLALLASLMTAGVLLLRRG